MSLRKLASAAFALLVLAGVAGGPRVAAGARADNLTYLTFSRAVALPGVTLQPGTYAFELSSPYTAANVVLVRDRARTRALYQGFTHRVPRPANWNERRQVQFGESAHGAPAPILAWYPLDTATGFEFIYPRE